MKIQKLFEQSWRKKKKAIRQAQDKAAAEFDKESRTSQDCLEDIKSKLSNTRKGDGLTFISPSDYKKNKNNEFLDDVTELFELWERKL